MLLIDPNMIIELSDAGLTLKVCFDLPILRFESECRVRNRAFYTLSLIFFPPHFNDPLHNEP
jgi:hypothetical protein